MPGFSAVIGNPPYIDSESMSKEMPIAREVIGKMYSAAVGNWDIFIPFFDLSLTMIEERGVTSLITPTTIIASDYAINIQKKFLDNDIQVCHDFSDARPFKDADVSVAIITVRKNSSNDPVIFIKYDDKLKPMKRVESSHELLRKLPPGYIGAPLYAENYHELEWIDSDNTVIDVAMLSDGATTGEAYKIKEIVSDLGPNEVIGNEMIKLVNTGTIDPFQILWGSKKCVYLGFKGERPIIQEQDLFEIAPRRLAQAKEDKVVMAGMGKQLEAVVAESGILCGKSAILVRLKEGYCPHALAAFLNAPCTTRLYRALFGLRGFGKGSMNIGPRQIEALPAPNVDVFRPAMELFLNTPNYSMDDEELNHRLYNSGLLSAMGQYIISIDMDDEASTDVYENALSFLDRVVSAAFARLD